MTTSVVAAWAEYDAARALHPSDRSAIGATEAARSLVVDLFAADAARRESPGRRGSTGGGARHEPPRDLYNACARLGALLAEAGASPSLAGATIDNAARALTEAGAPFDAAGVSAARASLVEGYVAAVRDAERGATLASWEYPACAVPLGDDAVAIACGYPADDGEALGAWAARIAGRLVKAKVRRVVLSGAEAARAEVASAVTLVGIEVTPDACGEDPAAKAATAKGWLRLPWRK
ncbi:MAG: hypothetical protein KF764_33015 [Labilithrix sp.]|nr:hypothetical protein [Labilithrix sp.]